MVGPVLAIAGIALYAALGFYIVGMLIAFWRTRRKVFLGFLLLPLVPLVLIAGVTGYEYFDGTVRVPGSPVGARGSREMHNLDRDLRVLSGERIGQNFPWTRIVRRTRRRTLEFLVDQLGPVPGSYQGPYPDREMAFAAVRAAQVFVEPPALSQPLVVDGRSIHLQPKDIERIFGWRLPPQEAISPSVALKLFEGTCLLVGLRFGGGYYHVEMVDTSGFGWFGRYVFWSERD